MIENKNERTNVASSATPCERLVLALETSCDETAASVVRWIGDGEGEILSNIVYSQINEHAAYGGVVPEIAARAHVDAMDGIVRAALREAELEASDMDAIAATCGPGLNGGLLVATITAKVMAKALGKPFYPVNHLEGHALTARLTDGIAFPYLLLLVSGGHTQILIVHGVGHYRRLATTIDDALGEAFDKTAKMLSLDHPGGPAVEKAALKGDAERFKFPRPMQNHETLNLSLSGLKTAVRLAAEKAAPLDNQDVADICASFQAAVADVLENRIARAFMHFRDEFPDLKSPTMVVAGGVAANKMIAERLRQICEKEDWTLSTPPLALCTDNAAMIAWAAAEHIAIGNEGDMDFTPRPRWPLDTMSEALVGHGKRGAKV
ncbi:MAG: tRNA (adenosine(37)-N6)-threonylcarbamoyltransferase complex transferase subunit TsaD [Hyphomicrobiales bacterium]